MKVKSTHAAPALLIAVLALLCAFNFIDTSSLGLDQNVYLSLVVIQLVVFALPTLFFVRLRSLSYINRLRFRPIRAKHSSVIVSVTVLMITGSAALGSVMYKLMPSAYEAGADRYSQFLASGSVFDIIYVGVTFALLPAITEELLFRSVLCAEYEKCGILPAAIISSLSFSLFHLSFARLPINLFCGLVLFAVMTATRSVFASVAVHFLNNIALFFIDRLLGKIVGGSAASPILFGIAVMTVAMIAAICFFAACEKLYRGYGEEGLPSPERIRPKKGELAPSADAFLSPTFLIFLIFAITATAISTVYA